MNLISFYFTAENKPNPQVLEVSVLFGRRNMSGVLFVSFPLQVPSYAAALILEVLRFNTVLKICQEGFLYWES